MFTRLQIANFGLTAIGASSIRNLTPASTSLERHIGANFEFWKRSELAKRRWVFATDFEHELELIETKDTSEYPYRFTLPDNCLRVIRNKDSRWRQSRRTLQNTEDTLCVDLVWNVDENDFDPLFVDVLAARVAMGSAEYVTQSNTKKGDADAKYREAVLTAGRANAYVIGPEDYTSGDEDNDWLSERY